MRLARRERAHGDAPPVPDPADHEVFITDRRRGLVELGAAGDLHNGADLDTGLIHRHEQIAQTGMAFTPGFGPGDDKDPIGELGKRGPDLLTVDDPATVNEFGARLHIGQV